jgi:hypothetical protein
VLVDNMQLYSAGPSVLPPIYRTNHSKTLSLFIPLGVYPSHIVKISVKTHFFYNTFICERIIHYMFRPCSCPSPDDVYNLKI